MLGVSFNTRDKLWFIQAEEHVARDVYKVLETHDPSRYLWC